MGEKKRRSARQTIAKELPSNWPSGFQIAQAHMPPPAEDIRRNVASFKQLFDQDRFGFDPVLRALEYVAVARIQGVQWGPTGQFVGLPEVQPDNGVMVPWWALNALVAAVQEARDKNLSLDEVMGLRGVGRGKRSWPQAIDEMATHLCRAHEVHYLVAKGTQKTDAVTLVAERYGLDAKSVWTSLAAAKGAGFKALPDYEGGAKD